MELKEDHHHLTLEELIIYQDPYEKRNFFLHYGDVTDAISVSS